jgi:hypothetical protein
MVRIHGSCAGVQNLRADTRGRTVWRVTFGSLEPSVRGRAISSASGVAQRQRGAKTSWPLFRRQLLLRWCGAGAHLYVLSPKARQLLRCKAHTRGDTRCRAYVVAGLDVCISHSPWRSRGPGSKRPPIRPSRQPCRCEAYTWPHRRGSGVCRWPDAPQTPCIIPAGTRHSARPKANQRAQAGRLHELSKRAKTALPECQEWVEPTVVCRSRVNRAPRYF